MFIHKIYVYQIWQTLSFAASLLSGFLYQIVCAALIYPGLLPFFTVVLIYRSLVKTVVQWKDPTCRRILTGLDACIVGPDPYDKSTMALAPYFLFSEKVDRDQVLKLFTESILKQNIYPELKQRLVRKWGYYFWKDVENFKLDHHIRYLYPISPDKLVYRADLRGDIGEKIVYSGFDERYSPWELILVPNVVDPDNPAVKSAIYFHVNHYMMDGLSITKMLERTASHPWEWPEQKTFSKDTQVKSKIKLTSYSASTFTTFKLLLAAPGYLIKTILCLNDSNEFLREALKPHHNKEMAHWSRSKKDPQRISLSLLKRIAQSHSVSLSSLIATITVAGVANFIKHQCNRGFSKLPEQFLVHMILPVPGHPEDKLVNRWTAVRLPFSIQSGNDPVKTLHQVNATFRNLARSLEPMLNYWLLSISGLLPNFLLLDPRKDVIRHTLLFTNFPGAKSQVDIFGYKKLDQSILGNATAGSAFLIGAQNLYDNFWIDAGMVSPLTQNEEDVHKLQNYIQNIIFSLST